MDETLRAHRDASIEQIEDLMRRGLEIKATLAVDVIREWQRDCAAVINQLSGGSKAHWLARAYSGAFLVRANDGAVVVEASATEIVDRILDVLTQARTSLAHIDSFSAAPSAVPVPRRFEFVRNPQLRPILVQAFAESARAFEDGDLESAFLTLCGILEAIITDALEAKGLDASGWSFDARIEAAQRAGLIGRGCVRLPAVARGYRDLAGDEGHVRGPHRARLRDGVEVRGGATVSERDARVVRQVLLVVMRDLDPSR